MTKTGYGHIPKACERWSVGRTKLYELVNRGDIRAIKVGSRTLVDLESGDNYFASLPAISKGANGRQL